jgi:putative membrane protein
MRFLIRLLVNMAAIVIIAHLAPRLIAVDNFGAALIAAVLLGIVNAVIRPILVILTFPLTLLSLGLFLLVINGLMLWVVAAFVPGFHVNGFSGAFFGSLLITVVTWIIWKILPF